MISGHRSLELVNDMAELGRLTEEIEAYGTDTGLSPRTVSEINLALEEVVTNVISYAFDAGGKHVVKVDLRLDNGDFSATVEDDGRPFNPLETAEPDVDAPLEERTIGGLGIFLVRKLMDDVTYSRTNGRNVLVMRKHCEASGPEAV